MYGITVKNLGKVPKKVNHPICIQGLPDISNVGTEAVKQLVERLEAKKVMELGFNDLPPIIIINDGIPHLPVIQIHFWKDPQNKQDIFFVSGDDQPLSSRGIYTISQYLAELMSKNDVQLIVTLGAYLVETSSRNDPVKIYVAATHKENEHLEKLLSLPHAKPMTEGEILGANGMVPTLAKQKFNIDGAIILSETSAQIASTGTNDPNATTALVETMKKYFNLPLNGTPTKTTKHSPPTNEDKKPPKVELPETYNQSSYIG
ncbi:MAG: PAC2 family protein [Candidatus Freyarchaeum deiterrae]